MSEIDDRDKPVGQDAPEWTNRKATARVRNNWGVDLVSVTLRHRRANDPSKQEQYLWRNVASGDTTPADLTVNYETGIGADFDYWFITFQLNNGDIYVSKNSFYCNLTSDDEGGVVTGVCDLQYKRFSLLCPKSSSCDTDSITKLVSEDEA
jgi:hypothetical protein